VSAQTPTLFRCRCCGGETEAYLNHDDTHVDCTHCGATMRIERAAEADDQERLEADLLAFLELRGPEYVTVEMMWREGRFCVRVKNPTATGRNGIWTGYGKTLTEALAAAKSEWA
jgi:hypothetical protein